ncbi:MAG TPA: DNA ligase D, partial [Paludibacter sp.]|nr:DNA ligase D [Paludibacter sp.]
MSLSSYHHKRNFRSTTEPVGRARKSKGSLVFVVQKHDASRLHYDFRLEIDGVLKSWAVPKGPSMNPGDKRLAVTVEDHPYDYKDFEGNISEGNYGAGNVIVWDNGTYSSIGASSGKEDKENIRDGLAKGHLSFRLDGKKLKGGFTLVKVHGRGENTWLLIKKDDEYATAEDVLEKEHSVISGNVLELKERKPAKRPAKVKPPVEAKTFRTEVGFVPPMLAGKVEEPFDGKDWIFEAKFDGYRAVAVAKAGRAELYSRNELSFTGRYRPIARELAKIGRDAVLDGEIVIEDERGRSGFQLLQQYQKTGKGNLKYYVFDIMNLDGNDTTGLKLVERKQILKTLLSNHELHNIVYSDHIEEKGKDFFDLAVKRISEGIMAKRAASVYRPGERSDDWLKIKITREEEAIVVGITEPNGTRKYFGSILLADFDENGELQFIGKCGTGFSQEILEDLYTQFRPFFTSSMPFDKKPKVSGKIQWLEPNFVAQVKYSEVTEGEHLRQPVFLGLRIDKSVENMKQPTGKQVPNLQPLEPPGEAGRPKAPEDNLEVLLGDITLKLTHQNKIYFPGDGISKGEIVGYYNEIADLMLPYLKDRPQNMNRFPNGIDSPGFFNKDVDVDNIPAWLKTERIFSESNNAYINYLVCNDRPTLLYMANLGCIEINPWNSTIHNLENPDWVAIDIDPDKQSKFADVAQVALTVKKVLDEIETECYCKTSGATGLHVYIPLNGRYGYDMVKIFAEIIARRVNSMLPGTTTLVRAVQKRNHKIYIDFLQNRYGQTLAAPYSARPKPGATVSTPLEWGEVNEKLSPTMFTIKNI